MSLQNDPLANYYADEEEEQEEVDPLAQYYADKKENPFQAPTKRLQEQYPEYEPDFGEELERAADFGVMRGTKGVISGASLGASEYVPGLETEEDDPAATVGKLWGSFLPISFLTKANQPLLNLAGKSPVLTKQLTSLANITGMGAAGGVYGAATEAIKKGELPSADDFLEHGAQWALLDGALQAAGGTYRFVKSLLSTSKSVKQPEWKVVNDVIEQMRKEGVDFSNPERVQAKALSILEDIGGQRESLNQTRKVTQPREEAIAAREKAIEDLQNTKISPKTLEPLNGRVEELAEPYVPNQFHSGEVAEQAVNKEVQESIELLGERAPTEKQLGENIRADVESGMKRAENEYRPAYELAEEAAHFQNPNVERTSTVASDTLKHLETLETNPAGYKQVMKTLETVLKDAGYVINRNEKGLIEHVVKDRDIFTNDLMELGRRLNKVVTYDALDKTVSDRLKPVIKAIKEDIRASLQNHPEALELWNEAERKFGESAAKFGRDSIRNIRSTQTPERLAKVIRTPSALADIKQAVSEKQFREIERELMEYMNSLPEDRAKAFYREIGPQLSTDAQVIAGEILDSKIPMAVPGRNQRINESLKESVLNDLSKSVQTGERPKTALNLWKTKQGRQIVENALKDSPNKKEMVDYLSKQSFYDFSSSFIGKDGAINFKKLGELMKDPATVENIRFLGGDDAVNFFKNLEVISNKIEHNIKALEDMKGAGDILTNFLRKESKEAIAAKGIRGQRRIEKMAEKDFPIQVKVSKFFNSLDKKTLAILGLLGVANAGSVVKSIAIYKTALWIAKNKKVRDALKHAASARHDPKALIYAIESMDKINEQD